MAKTTHNICILKGDGIGPEVISEAVKALKALPISLNFIYGEIGYNAYLKKGDSLPEETIKKVMESEATLLGAVTTPPNIKNYVSPILRLRQKLELFANIRPCKSLPISISRKGINMCIIRENTEGLYCGRERVEDKGNRAITEMVVTKKGSERIIRHAFEFAKKNSFKKVSVVHKANVLRETTGLFLRVAKSIAKEYPEIEMNDLIVDNCAMQLIKNPSQFDVIVTTNMFGDILSDEASALVGGLGVAYSGNIGIGNAVFEPVHGSAPKYAQKNIANPLAALFSAKLMLEYINEKESADALEKAIIRTMKKGITTKDLGGRFSTSEVGDAVRKEILEIYKNKRTNQYKKKQGG